MNMTSKWIDANQDRFKGQIQKDEPLSKYTYYKIGGKADFLITPKSMDDLKWIDELFKATATQYTFLGLGSNVLISDQGLRGVVIRTTKLALEIETKDSNEVVIGASVPISLLLRKAALEGWDGFEFLAGIPGSIGGAVAMNAGTHLGESESKITEVSIYNIVDGSSRVLARDQLKFSYRHNHFLKPGDLVVQTVWSRSHANPIQVKEKIDSVLSRRKDSQPIELPSCGSVFKNPKPKHAWQVIEELGLRGHQIGGAQFSPKHCNFIVNTGDAKASDVKALIDLAKYRAQEKLGITLEEEVRYLGDF